MLLFDPTYLFMMLILYAWIPGLLVGIGLLWKTKMSIFEMVMISLIIGLFFPAMLSFIENFAGMPFNYEMVLMNVGITGLLGLALIGYNVRKEGIEPFKQFLFKPFNELKTILNGFKTIKSIPDLHNHLKTWSTWFAQLALILILLLIIFSRMATWGPIYFELDPYYYIEGGRQLLEIGEMPLHDDSAWYPEVNPTHRGWGTLLSYMDAHWYTYYTNGGTFERYLYSTVTSLYPPIASMLLAFAIYLLIKEEYGHWLGVIAGIFIYAIPSLTSKMFSGTMEAQPLALMGIVLALALYALMIKRKRIEYAILAIFSILIIGWGATSLGLFGMVVATYIIIQSTLNFISNKDIITLVKWNLPILGAIIFNDLIMTTYRTEAIDLGFLLGSKIILIAGALVVAIALNYIKNLSTFKNMLPKIGVIAIIIILGLVFFITPYSQPIKGPLGSYLSGATYTSPLARTIQEHGLTGKNLTQWLGTISTPLGILEIINIIPTIFLNITFGLLNYIVAILFDLPNLIQQTPTLAEGLPENSGLISIAELIPSLNKQSSLVMTFIFLSILSVIVELVYRISTGKEKDISIPLLMMVFMLPVIYIGFNKLKFMVYASIAVTMAMAIPAGAIGKGFKHVLNTENDMIANVTIKTILITIVLVIAIGASLTSLSSVMVGSSLMPRYSENPIQNSQMFKDLCNEKGILCEYANPLPNMTVNEQYSQTACVYSITPRDLIVNGNGDIPINIQNSYLRCSRIQSYWIDVYDWMKENTPANARITSWWDYGHWTNYFGDRKTVLRNEHTSNQMIEMTAYAYLHGNERELWEYMDYFDSDYALFDVDLIGGASNMGGKYGALDYLGCAHIGKTNELHGPQESYCEQNNLWEEVFVSENGNQCEYAPGKTGTVVYGTDAVKTMDNGFEQGSRVTSKKYCLGTTEIVYNNNVQEISALYKLNETDGDGLKLLRAIMVPQGTRTDSSTGRTINVYWLMFVKDSLWIVNNTATSGWEDRTTEFYNSNMYKAFFLKQVDGFQLVYDNGGVLVYKRNAIAPDGVVEYPAPN